MAHKKRYVRYLILLLILLAVSSQDLYFYLKVVSWDEPLTASIIPINGDGREETEEYIQNLRNENIENISSFLNKEALRYGISKDPVITIQLAEEIKSLPPKLPSNSNNIISNIYWSLAFRIWSNWALFNSNSADINLFIVLFDPSKYKLVDYSVGLQKGMIGLINAYADEKHQGSNNVIITHELLHILGATDKYYTQNNYPIFPIGFANPDKTPLFPQTKAEIMGGRIPLSPNIATIPDELSQVIIGKSTAFELNWISM